MKSFKELEDAFYAGVHQELLDGLLLCTEAQQHLFKRMYAGGDLEQSIHQVVEAMSRGDLACAMGQVKRTLEKKSG